MATRLRAGAAVSEAKSRFNSKSSSAPNPRTVTAFYHRGATPTCTGGRCKWARMAILKLKQQLQILRRTLARGCCFLPSDLPRSPRGPRPHHGIGCPLVGARVLETEFHDAAEGIATCGRKAPA